MTLMRKVLALGVLLGLVAAATLTWQDFVMQNNYRDVLLVLDYSSVQSWAKRMGQEEEALLSVAKQNGVTVLAIQERELYTLNQKVYGFFEEDAEVLAATGMEILKDMTMQSSNSIWTSLSLADIDEENIYIYSLDKQQGRQLYQDAVYKYGTERVTDYSLPENSTGYMFELSQSVAEPVHGLGFDQQIIERLQGLGFEVTPRLENYYLNADEASNLSSYWENILSKTQPQVIIFAGMNGILGSPYQGQGANLLSTTAQYLQSGSNDEGPLYGHIEMTKLDGDTNLAQELSYHLARVHSIGLDEWQSRYNHVNATQQTISDVVERYLLAVNDRSVHVLYLRPFSKSLDFNQTFFNTLKLELANRDYQLGSVSALPGRTQLPTAALLLMGIGAGCAFLLLLNLILPELKTWLWILLGVGIGTVTGIVYLLPDLTILLQRGIALGSAVTFPLLAILLGIDSEKADGRIATMLKSFLMIIAVTFAGALYVHGSLAIKPFMTAINVFPAVKVALLAPAVLYPILYWLQEVRKVDQLVEFLGSPIRVFHVLLGGISVLALGFLVMRSGNNPILGVSTLELKMRLFLQDLLVARPRNKEFMVGYPLLLLALYLKVKGHKRFIWLALAGGVIGLSSLINTFAHLHKPVWMALLTSFNGLWLGVIVGLAFIAVYHLLSFWLRKLMAGDES